MLKTGQNIVEFIEKTGQMVYLILGGENSCIEKIQLLSENG